MKKINKYYVPFVPNADINYFYLFSLYEIAEYQSATNSFSLIAYTSQRELADNIGVSTATIGRIIKSKEYKSFLTIDTKTKTIILNNSFKGIKKQPYVILTAEEVTFLRSLNDNLLTKYLIYLKYYCGFTGNKTDFTAKQFLIACGYSANSNEMISKISRYNAILKENGFIDIKNYRDNRGFIRNMYIYTRI